MTVYSGLFNSINGDRLYDEWWFARYFSRFIGNGVFPNPSTGLQVTEGENMTTVIKAGDGWINGYFLTNDSNYVLNHDIADGVLKRIDRVVMRLNYSGRIIEFIIKKGAFASSPVAPEIRRDPDYYELVLADVLIVNGATQILQSNITDQRLNTELCGIVHGTVDQVDTTTLFNQYQSWITQQKLLYEQDLSKWTQAQKDLFNSWSDAQKADFLSWRSVETDAFNTWKTTETDAFDAWQTQERANFDTWFETIKDILSGDVAANLQLQIDALKVRMDDLEATVVELVEESVADINQSLNQHINDDSRHVTQEFKDYVSAIGSRVADNQRETAYLKLKQDAADRIEGGTLFADDRAGNGFGMSFKNVRTKSIEPLNIGETLLSQGSTSKIGTVENGQFIVGDNVIVLDDVTSETVSITRSETLDEVATNTVTDATVVSSAYTTSASARPVVLDNGWIVTSVYDPTNLYVYFYVDKQDGQGFKQLCYINANAYQAWSIISKGTMIYFIGTYSNQAVSHIAFDATTVTNTNQWVKNSYIDTSQTAFNGVSLAISPDKTTLWATWSSKNATYPNSFNIRACKGTIQGNGSVVWGSVEQVSQWSGAESASSPSVTFHNNKPIIIFAYNPNTQGNGNSIIYSTVSNGTSWVYTAIYATPYTQSNPQVVSDKNGVLLCVWWGKDSTDTTYNKIRFSKSTDGGVTWSVMERLTDGIASRIYPTITVNKNNEIFIVFQSSTTYNKIEQIKYANGAWGVVESIFNDGDINRTNASLLYDNTFSLDFEKPLIIFTNISNSKVGFYGTWNSIKEQFYLECSPLQNSYKKGAWITQSTMNTDGTFPSWDGSFVTNDVKDATVVNAAYDTSGNGGRKLVRLTNGWLVAGGKDGVNNRLYISKDDGLSWSIIGTLEYGGNDFSLSSKGNILYAINTSNSDGSIRFYKYDVTTWTGTQLITHTNVLDNAQTTLGNVSLTINPQGTELHAAWASKNSTYPNSFNIRYAKGTINGDGSVTWGSVSHVTTLNNSVINMKNPSIIVAGNGYPVIAVEQEATSNYDMNAYRYNGSAWLSSYIYDGTSYAQSSPSAMFVPKEINGLPNGRIWVAWHGRDATDTSGDNIRVSYSDDGGVTWSAMQKLTSGSVNLMSFPSISVNKDNKIFITYHNNTGVGGIFKLEHLNGTWVGPATVVNGQNSISSSSLLDYSLDFNEPLFIYMNRGTTPHVGFYGKWTIGSLIPLVSSIAQYELPSTDYVGAFVKGQGNITDVKANINGEIMDSEFKDGEYKFEKALSSPVPVKLILEATRQNTANGSSDKITRILGGRA